MRTGSLILYLSYGTIAAALAIGAAVYFSQEDPSKPAPMTQAKQEQARQETLPATAGTNGSVNNPFLPAAEAPVDQAEPTFDQSPDHSPDTTPDDKPSEYTLDRAAAQTPAGQLSALLEKLNGLDAPEPDMGTIQLLWRLAGDTQQYDEVIAVLQRMAEMEDQRISAYAQQVIADLERVRGSKVREIDQLAAELYMKDSPDAAIDEPRINDKVIEKLSYLSQYADTEEERTQAFQVLAGNRLPQTIDLLEQSFTALQGDARMQAVQTLYQFAADDIERERATWLLRTAAMDQDENISSYARNAVNHLSLIEQIDNEGPPPGEDMAEDSEPPVDEPPPTEDMEYNTDPPEEEMPPMDEQEDAHDPDNEIIRTPD